MTTLSLRVHARTIWDSAVAAVKPAALLRTALAEPELQAAVRLARRLIVVGGGKAGAAMAESVEELLAEYLPRMTGLVNVPADGLRPLRVLRLHAARPAGENQPTAEGEAGARQIVELVDSAGPEDVVLCLISGGGSALLPLPADGVPLADKQRITRQLHACGAAIQEMNAVRKHLSRIKGGQLVSQFAGRNLFSLIISDVVGDPLDVIASGPTAADPATFAEALAVLERYRLTAQAPASVLRHLQRGAAREIPETLKELPKNVSNRIIGNNARALAAARTHAESLGYRVVNLGSFIEGETKPVAIALAGMVRSIRAQSEPAAPPVCLLSGGETTVTLAADHGRGGRNQEFVLAAAAHLGQAGLAGVVVLSGGTDGEDGPTDAAGAIADAGTLARAAQQGHTPAAFLARNDAYRFFEATGDLLKTGLTQTNVMDVRVILVGNENEQQTT